MKLLLIFDFDNTIAYCNSFIYVNKTNGTILKMNMHEYQEYTLELGDVVDPREFQYVVDPILNKHLFNILKANQKDSVILTARSWSDPVKEYLLNLGVDVPIHAVGLSDEVDSVVNNAKRKKEWIKQSILKNNYSHVEFWDDCVINIEKADELTRELRNVSIKTHLVTFPAHQFFLPPKLP